MMISQLLWDEEWRTQFEKEVYFWFILHNGFIWPHAAFGPLVVEIFFPILPSSRPFPGQVKQEHKRVVELGWALSQMSKSSDIQVRDYLRKLWLAPRSFPHV